VLSNSYAFAYFFFGGELFSGEFTADENQVNQNLFEDSQEQLAVEVRLWTCTASVAFWSMRSQIMPC
jgi:hypothetical protein